MTRVTSLYRHKPLRMGDCLLQQLALPVLTHSPNCYYVSGVEGHGGELGLHLILALPAPCLLDNSRTSARDQSCNLQPHTKLMIGASSCYSSYLLPKTRQHSFTSPKTRRVKEERTHKGRGKPIPMLLRTIYKQVSQKNTIKFRNLSCVLPGRQSKKGNREIWGGGTELSPTVENITLVLNKKHMLSLPRAPRECSWGHCVREVVCGQEAANRAPNAVPSATHGQLCSPACAPTTRWRDPPSNSSSSLMSTRQHHDNDGKYLHTIPLTGCLDHLATRRGEDCQTHGPSTNPVPRRRWGRARGRGQRPRAVPVTLWTTGTPRGHWLPVAQPAWAQRRPPAGGSRASASSLCSERAARP